MNKKFSKLLLTSASAVALLAAYPSVAQNANEALGLDLPSITAEAATAAGNAFVKRVMDLPNVSTIASKTPEEIEDHGRDMRSIRRAYNRLSAADKDATVEKWEGYLYQKERAIGNVFVDIIMDLHTIAEIEEFDTADFAAEQKAARRARNQYNDLSQVAKENASVVKWLEYLDQKEQPLGITFVNLVGAVPNVSTLEGLSETELEVANKAIAAAEASYDELSDAAKADALVERWLGHLAEKKEAIADLEVIEEELTIESVSAIAADTLQVTFNQAADVENVKLAVTRAGNAVTGKFAWSKNNTVATFKSDGKLVKGLHTVTATSTADENFKAEGSVEIKDQMISEIVIENEEALSGKDRKEAYVFYDVLDQYGESIRNTTSITWTASVKNAKANRTTGEITLSKGDNTEFTFGDKVYLTGVDTRNGVSVQKEIKIGQPRALDALDISGFVKKGTSKKVTDLPKGFKSGEYYMVFESLDQNGNIYPADNLSQKDITFVSLDPLLISKLEHDVAPGETEAVKTLVIDGVEMAAMFVQPGMNVDQGGEVTLRAIATKTGKQTEKNIVVGEVETLTKFDMQAPSGILAEGESFEIPFEAADQNGMPVTNFTTLAKKAGVKELKINQPTDATLELVEKNDGTAALMYTPNGMAWSESEATNGIDRPVSLSTIVIGGNASNLMLNISDKARPVGIKEVDLDNTLVSQGKTEIKLDRDIKETGFKFVDQYGRNMDTKDLHAQAYDFINEDSLKGQDFDGYKYSIRATYKGTDGYFSAGTPAAVIKNDDELSIRKSGDTVTVKAVHSPGTVASGNVMRFEIVKKKGSEDVETVSPAKTEELRIVNINQVKGIAIKDIGKVHLKTDHSGKVVFPDGTALSGEAKESGSAAAAPATHKRDVKVVGNYNADEVVIPSDYITYLQTDDSKLAVEAGKITKATDNLKWSDLYDETTARLLRKDAKETVNVQVYDRVIGDSSAIPGLLVALETAQTHLGDAVENAQADVTTKEQALGTKVGELETAATTAIGTIITDLESELNTELAKAEGSRNADLITQATELKEALESLLVKIDVAKGKGAKLVAADVDPVVANAVTAVKTKETAYASGVGTVTTTSIASLNLGTEVTAVTDAITALSNAKKVLAGDQAGTGTAGTNPGYTNVQEATAALATAKNNLAAVGEVYATASKEVTISDARPVLSSVTGADEWTVNPTKTEITGIESRFADADKYKFVDQYGVEIDVSRQYRISQIEENEAGYADNNFNYSGNDTRNLTITGAERGDTFVITVIAKDDNNSAVSKVVKVTVGSDTLSKVGARNNYLEDLIGKKDGTGLEKQRLDSLK